MNVFISWSGENTASHKIAIAIRDWLPCVINTLTPFVSSEDIQKGERGLSKIEELLKDSSFGIICVTKENYKAPWLLFESGALSNNPKKVPVVPFLFKLTPSDLTGSPLTQFQATTYLGKENIKKLIESLNNVCGDRKLSDFILNKSFEKWYPDLEGILSSIDSDEDLSGDESIEKIDKNRSILEEILEITRNNQKALSSGVVSDVNINDKFYFLLKNAMENINKEMSCNNSYINKNNVNNYNCVVEIDNSNSIILEINQKMTLMDILDEIYFSLNGKVEAFTYLIDWILEDEGSGKRLVVSDVHGYIPAHTLFQKKSSWKVKFLQMPYAPSIDANRHNYRN